jgi:hypothetical protein
MHYSEQDNFRPKKISKATQREDAMDKKKLTELVLPGYDQKPLAILLLFVRRRHFIQSAFETIQYSIQRECINRNCYIFLAKNWKSHRIFFCSYANFFYFCEIFQKLNLFRRKMFRFIFWVSARESRLYE